MWCESEHCRFKKTTLLYICKEKSMKWSLPGVGVGILYNTLSFQRVGRILEMDCNSNDVTVWRCSLRCLLKHRREGAHCLWDVHLNTEEMAKSVPCTYHNKTYYYIERTTAVPQWKRAGDPQVGLLLQHHHGLRGQFRLSRICKIPQIRD